MSKPSPAKTEELLEQITEGITALVSGDDWAAWLTVAAKFGTYSLNNTIAIWTQRPDATRVAGYRAWQSLGRQVDRGEKAIRILAPVTYRATEPDKTDDHGEEVNENVRLVGFRSAAVFDIAQTSGEPIAEPPPAVELTGNTSGDTVGLLVAVIEAEGFAYTVGRLPDRHQGAYGLTDYTTRTVTVRSGLAEGQRATTTAHEAAHVLLHDPDDDEGRSGLDRQQREVEAESVAFIVMENLGVDAGGYSFPYLARWSGGDIERIRASAKRITSCANQITNTNTIATAAVASQAA